MPTPSGGIGAYIVDSISNYIASSIAGTGGSVVASLSLNFSTGTYIRNGVTFPDFATFLSSTGSTFVRAGTNASYMDVSGILQASGANAARFNYDANYPRGGAVASLTGPFLLYEPTATNLLLQSNAFTTSWSALNGITVSAAVGTSPDGTNDAWRNQANVSTFGGNVQALTLAAIQYTHSGWVKRNTGADQSFAMGPTLATLAGKTATVNWIRHIVTATPVAATANLFFTTANGAPAYDVQVFGTQIETGAVATSYIATTTGTAARSADAFTIVVPAGLSTLTVTFDDNSTQVINGATGSYLLTTTLNRPNIKSMAWA